MTPARHPGLTDPGETHPGDQLDCPECRTGLLASFSAPAEYAPAPEPEGFTGAHRTSTSVVAHLDAPGGLWAATCPCGWSRSGLYARDGIGAVVAERLAQAWAARHLAHPLEPAEDEPRPHPETTRTLNLIHTARWGVHSPAGQAGEWFASCSCGWQREGRFGSPGDDLPDLTHARTWAQSQAEEHAADPGRNS